MVSPFDPFGANMSDKAKAILSRAAKGGGTRQGLITFDLPKVSGPHGMVADPTGIETCTAGDETMPDSGTSHRTSLEYREAAREIAAAHWAEHVADDTYRLTLEGYRQADRITETGS